MKRLVDILQRDATVRWYCHRKSFEGSLRPLCNYLESSWVWLGMLSPKTRPKVSAPATARQARLGEKPDATLG